jgi:hypothetical protein
MAQANGEPTTAAGHRAALRPALRWLVLVCTLLGLTAMHTLGHTLAMPDRHATRPLQAAATMLAAHAAQVAGPIQHGCPHGCAHLADGRTGGEGSMSWSVCLAVLAAFAVALLLGWLLRAATHRGGPNRPTGPLTFAPRAPPLPPMGLLLADLSVLRR